MKVLEVDPNTGALVHREVPFNDNILSGVQQGLGFGIGATAAVVKMATVDLIGAALGTMKNTQIGLGVRDGYQTTYYKRDVWLEKRRVSAATPDQRKEFCTKNEIALNQGDEEIITQIAHLRVVHNDQQTNRRYPSQHTRKPGEVMPEKQRVVQVAAPARSVLSQIRMPVDVGV